jgi:Flp pilus assembly protein TadB
LSAIIPSEKVLLALLAANAVQIVIWAVKEWLKHREKKDDKTSERMDKMQADIAEIKSALRVINSRDTVTHSEMIELLKPHIELIVIKSMRK